MPRLRLDPTSPSGISIAPDDPTIGQLKRSQGHGYVSNKATGLIKAGTNVTLSGTGVSNDPYVINSSGSGGGTSLPADASGWLHDDGAGTLAWTTPAKSDVGLGNVDNTSDATKNSAIATLTNKTLTKPVMTASTNQPGLAAGMVWYSSANKTLQMADGADSYTETALKSDLTAKANTADLATVATTGSYTDLTSKPTIPSVIDDLSDVTITTPSNGQVLKYNGTAWVNGTDATGSGGTSLPADAAGWLHDNGTGTLAWTTPTATDVGLGSVTNDAQLKIASNLSDLANTTTARTNLGLGSLATKSTVTLTTDVTGTLPVNHGGTGATTLTGIVKGNGTSAMTAATAGTDYSVPAGTETLTNKTITSPKLNQINDTNGKTSAIIDATASAVNYLHLANAATGNAPAVTADGTDTNINLFLRGKGTGTAILADGSGNAAFVGIGAGGTPVNYLTATNAATTAAPKLTATGTDTNIDVEVDPKGTGSLYVNAANGLKLLGSASVPTTPATGIGKIVMAGSGNTRPRFINASGTLEGIVTSLNTGNSIIQVGTITSSTSTVVTVTFPTAFSSAPIVIGNVLDNYIFCTMQVQTISATTCTLSAFNTAGTRVAVTLQWLAIGS